ncbi:toxin glutamine deamidase domain-containing protein [Ellagibacter isourolithinifaciens]|uniref:toxin glutamine deamidase domain-containing protein n=1 Tax=Ellagibacter isourolithinifaciens TaxID=2137581 RepID=UPI003A9502E8
MGGRGKVSLTRQSGKYSGGLGGKVPESLKEAIGSKGAPNSIAESVVKTNPNYNASYREFSENCQRCVVAYELNRRGYNVTALPTFKGDTLPNVAHYNMKSGTFEGRWKGAFRNAKTVNVGAKTEAGAIANIESAMKSYGSGSRAVVQIFYKGGGGHVFNVENQRGRIVYVEAQAGKMKNIERTMRSVDSMSVNLVRTDNLKLSDRARNFVTRR